MKGLVTVQTAELQVIVSCFSCKKSKYLGETPKTVILCIVKGNTLVQNILGMRLDINGNLNTKILKQWLETICKCINLDYLIIRIKIGTMLKYVKLLQTYKIKTEISQLHRNVCKYTHMKIRHIISNSW